MGNITKYTIFILVAIGIGVGYWLVSPLFIDKEVSETMEDIMSDTASADVISQGTFEGLAGHNGEGTATLIRGDDGYYIRFEDDFRVTNGPDLYVYMGSNGEYNPDTEISELKGNVGSQNYKIPDSISVEENNEIWIWCKAFSVEFAKAELK